MNIVVNSVRELASKSDLVITTGGTSVDPDDITAQAMANAGVVYEMKGTPIQPGNNMTVGYLNDVPVCAVPAAALHFTATSLDILFPRMLAGEKITKEDLAKLAHGGLCHFCKKNAYIRYVLSEGAEQMIVDRHEAKEILKSALSTAGTEIISVRESFGRVLAEDILTVRDYPDTRKSAVDGYAHMVGSDKYILKGETGAGRKGPESISSGETVFCNDRCICP